jgi:hypothetical protein
MTLVATFLGSAKSRLLPLSIPFRFFAAAAGFHVLMWVAMLVGASELTSFRGGLGPVLAAVHLLTLGVLTATAMGAAVQLLPVATKRSLPAIWPVKLLFWLLLAGLLPLIGGMVVSSTKLLIAGSLVTFAALALFATVLAENLRRAGSLQIVAAYGWAALVSLVVLAAIGVTLAVNYERGLLPDHGAAALVHLILGGFGFMGLLAVGFSHVLIPMFTLSAAPDKRWALLGFALAVVAIALAAAGPLVGSRPTLTAGTLIGLAAVGVHLALMRRSLANGMRKRLGLSFLLVRIAWVMLPVTLVVGLAAAYGAAGPNGATLFGFLLFFGWLLTFLLGILQRIVPFLASMHATRPQGGAPPALSELAAAWPIKLHAACHLVALVVVGASIAMDAPLLARVGAAVGLLGATAFAWFTADVLRRVLRVRRA